MASSTCPSRGDVVWLDFDPQLGHEQAGHRPAVVLSHRDYNLKAGLAIICPMTRSTEKPWPFLVKVEESSAVIADQIRCIDWKARRVRIRGRVPDDVLERVVAIFCRLILPTAS